MTSPVRFQIAVDAADPHRLADFWAAALGWAVEDHGAKAGKNRLHVDLNVGRDRLDAETERLTALGATVLYRVDEPAGFHVTLQDPEGNEFCMQ